jgi:Lipoprotein amino terminal region
MALYSLYYSASEFRAATLPVFSTILTNPAETTEMRIGAFDILMRMNPPMSLMHRVAALTWTDDNKELVKAINIALATLSNVSNQVSI